MKKLLLSLFLVSAFAGANAQSTILSEDFEGGALPSGWTITTAATDGGWVIGNNVAVQSASFPIPAHTIMACSNDDKCNCVKANDLFKTPSMDFTGHTSATLSVDIFFGHLTYQGITETGTIEVSTDGGITWSVERTLPGDVAWITEYVNLDAYAGMPSVMVGFRYGDGGGWLYGYAIDNVNVFEPAATDISFTTINPATGSGAAYGAVSSNVTLGGSITNNGISPITTFTVKYSDGTTTWSDIKTGLNIASFATYNFTHATPFTVPALGTHNLQMWVELAGDVNQTNDTLNTTLQGVAFLPTHRVIFEEATGTWCGWCPRGTVFMDSMSTVHPDAILIAVHNADPMVNAVYDAGVGTAVAGYPSVLCNRGIVDDPSNMFPLYDASIGDFGFADITVTPTFDNATGILTTDVDAHFAADLNGNYRLALVITEDSLWGTANNWRQTNYYSFQSQNLPLVGAGFNWQTSPAYIPANQIHYDHVARVILGTFTGTTGSLPATIVGGNTYSYTFNYTKPAAYRLEKMHVYALLYDVTNNRFLNGNSGSITVGVQDLNSAISEVSLYPNPANDVINLEIGLIESQTVTVTVSDIVGKTYFSDNLGTLAAGNHKMFNDISKLSSGTYLVSIQTEKGVVTKKFVK